MVSVVGGVPDGGGPARAGGERVGRGERGRGGAGGAQLRGAGAAAAALGQRVRPQGGLPLPARAQRQRLLAQQHAVSIPRSTRYYKLSATLTFLLQALFLHWNVRQCEQRADMNMACLFVMFVNINFATQRERYLSYFIYSYKFKTNSIHETNIVIGSLRTNRAYTVFTNNYIFKSYVTVFFSML